MVTSDDRVQSPTLTNIRGDGDLRDCVGEIVQVGTSSVRELYIRCHLSGQERSVAYQARRLYACLPQILDRVGAELADVVLERVFFRDLDADYALLEPIRQAAYGAAGVSSEQLPLASYLGQPPCDASRAFELQAYAVVPTSSKAVCISTIPPTEGIPAAKLVEIDGYRHLYAHGLTGLPQPTQPARSFTEQSDAMFRSGGHLLRNVGSSFERVLRTWCYLLDIDRDYDRFNASRNRFFRSENVHRLPSSTGIGARLYPAGALCGIDLYALLNPEGATIEVMHAATLNEAPEYGSSFSRGMKLCLPNKTVLFVSGTASVDEAGATVHVGDAGRQIERMLLNVQELLTPQGASFMDVVQAISYLKTSADYDLFQQLIHERDLGQMPNSVVVADVCRPELLCEIEMIAVLPARGSSVEPIMRFGA